MEALFRVSRHFHRPLVVRQTFYDRIERGGIVSGADDGVAFAVAIGLQLVHLLGPVCDMVPLFRLRHARESFFVLGRRRTFPYSHFCHGKSSEPTCLDPVPHGVLAYGEPRRLAFRNLDGGVYRIKSSRGFERRFAHQQLLQRFDTFDERFVGASDEVAGPSFAFRRRQTLLVGQLG